MFSEYKGIPSQVNLLIYLSFIPNIAIGFIYTDLSYFLPEIQGIDPGLPIAVMGVTLVVLSVPFGILSDRYGKKKMLILGNVCASLSLIGFALTSNLELILLTAFLEGTGEAAYAVSFVALIAEKAGDEKRTPAYSLLAFVGWIAGALGGFSIYLVYSLEGVGFTFGAAHIVLYAAVGLLDLSVTPFFFLVKEGKMYAGDRPVLPRKSGAVMVKFGVYSVLIALGAGLFVPLMSLWFARAYNVPDPVSGPILGLTSLLTAGVVFVSPRLARRLGIVRATVITQAASTVFMVAIPSSPTFGIAASIYLVRVFLMNLSTPLTQSLIMGLVSPDERGVASGLSAALWRLPNSLSVNWGSALMLSNYLAAPFYIATALYVVGIALFWVLFRGARLPEEQSVVVQAPAQSSRLDGPEAER